MKTKTAAICFLVFWSLVSFYFGIGGSLKTENYNQISSQYNFNDTTSVKDAKTQIEYTNFAEMMLHKEDEKSEKIFPFLPIIPDFLGLILTACFFGMMGGIISILNEIALRGKEPHETRFISKPLLSFFMGLIILGLNYIVPTILVAGENKIRPITLLFFSLFAGMFSAQFYKFIASLVQSKLFPHEN